MGIQMDKKFTFECDGCDIVVATESQGMIPKGWRVFTVQQFGVGTFGLCSNCLVVWKQKANPKTWPRGLGRAIADK